MMKSKLVSAKDLPYSFTIETTCPWPIKLFAHRHSGGCAAIHDNRGELVLILAPDQRVAILEA